MNKLFLIPIVVFLLSSCRSTSEANKVCFHESCFDVEIVSAEPDLRRGLQFRPAMANTHGMLFIFKSYDPHSFWMKDTLIPLDMIWMDHARRIVHIEKNVPPCTADPCPAYTPSQNALYVLEINAGLSEKNRISLGDVADFKIHL